VGIALGAIIDVGALGAFFLVLQQNGQAVIRMRLEGIEPAVLPRDEVGDGREGAIIVAFFGEVEFQIAFPPVGDPVGTAQAVGLLAIEGVGLRGGGACVVVSACLGVVSRQAQAVAVGPGMTQRPGQRMAAVAVFVVEVVRVAFAVGRASAG